ncbi:HTH domain-containing protein [Microbacterium sp. NPDC087665]|uniref:HTH domain-containing protein n=1 Tax=Microbacterium sp. NPDC087665 TaxID=3364194 RepID=UPI0038123075
MTAFDVTDVLRRLVEDDVISLHALSALTRMREDALSSLLETPNGAAASRSSRAQPLSSDEVGRISLLTAQLTEGLRVDDDDRLRAMFDVLTEQLGLTHANIAALTRTDVHDLERFRATPATVPPQTKYELASRVSYLVHAAAQARGD